LKTHVSTTETIFDLGVPNPFKNHGRKWLYGKNTKGEDLDNNQTALQTEAYTVLLRLKFLNIY
jgi:hypothetical protein